MPFRELMTEDGGQKTTGMSRYAPSVQAVLFDLDGTFADTAPDLAAALNHVRAFRKLPPLPLSVLRPQASHGAAGLLKAGMNITPDMPEFGELRDLFLKHYADHICVHTRLFDGMADLVENLERRGIKWGIVTNKPHRYTLPLMQELGYADRAACLVSGNTCGNAKPHPEPLLRACQIAGVSSSQCIYLGDDLRDMQAANSAGMPGIIARYGYIDEGADLAGWNARAIIDRPMEMLDLLG